MVYYETTIANLAVLLHTYFVTKSYTIGALLEEARQLGFSLERRAFYDWVRWGLLAEATYQGKGRGDESRWSAQQRELFLTLLSARADGNRIVVLCNIPVWWWLRRGDAYVGIPQVRRALRTWGRAITAHTPSSARKAARQLLEQVQYPEYPRLRLGGRRDFVNGLADMVARKQVQQQGLAELMTPVFDREAKGTPRGAEGLQLSPESISEMIASRYDGIEHLDQLTDAGFEAARNMYLAGRGVLLANASDLESDPRLTNFRIQLDRNHEASTACHSLTALLGMVYRMSRQPYSSQGATLLTVVPQWQQDVSNLMVHSLSTPGFGQTPGEFFGKLERIVRAAENASPQDKDFAARIARGFRGIMKRSRKQQLRTIRAMSAIIMRGSDQPANYAELLLEMLRLLEQ